MSEVARWFIVGVVAMLVVFMIVWARGQDHHRGDDVGSLGAAFSLVSA